MYEGGTLKGNCTLYVWWMILGYLVVDAPLDAENIWGRGLGAVLECVWWVKTVEKKAIPRICSGIFKQGFIEN